MAGEIKISVPLYRCWTARTLDQGAGLWASCDAGSSINERNRVSTLIEEGAAAQYVYQQRMESLPCGIVAPWMLCGICEKHRSIKI